MKKVPFLDVRASYLEDKVEIDASYHRVMDSGRWILGPELEAFEDEFARYCGARFCVGVGNGLDAIYLSLRALGIGPGDEVIVPALTFSATWFAITRSGATPVAVEPEVRTRMPSAEAIAAAITPRTRAVVPVDLYGSVLDIEAVVALCRERGLALVEDAAQAHGAASSVARAGNHGIVGCFSFYPSKNLGAYGDGGAIVTSDPDICSRLRSLRNYGSSERYRHDDEGVNSRLDELQAAMLRVRLRRLDAYNARRQHLAQLYLQGLADLPAIGCAEPGPPGSHVWHLFVITSDRRDELQAYLGQHGCDTLIHYPVPIYRHAYFRAHAPAGTSASDRLTKQILSLPMGPHLDDASVRLVCELVREFVTRS